MTNYTVEPKETAFEEVVENFLRIIDNYEIRQKVEIINRISQSILKQESELSSLSEQPILQFVDMFEGNELQEMADVIAEDCGKIDNEW